MVKSAESILFRWKVLEQVDEEFMKGDERAVLKLVNDLQSKPGGLCCFGTVRDFGVCRFSLVIEVTYYKDDQDAKVTMLEVVYNVVRARKNSDFTCGYDWSAIRCFSSTGKRSVQACH